MPLVFASVVAWALILTRPFGMALPSLCTGGKDWAITRSLNALYAAPSALPLAVVLNPPATLALAWLLMLIAMMTPLLTEPLHHVWTRSFRSRRGRAVVLFVCVYLSVWCLAGLLLMVCAFNAQLVLGVYAFPAALLTGCLWQASPAKQFFLNRCHSAPPLSAFGAAADHDVLRYGGRQAVWCVGTCWYVMLLPLLVSRAHFLAMLLGALWAFAERYQQPGPLVWALRWPAQGARIAQARLRTRTRTWGVIAR